MLDALKDIIYAMTSPEKYRDFMNYKRSRVLLHTALLVIIGGICTMMIAAVPFVASGGFGQIIREEIPEFTVSSENGFWIEEAVEIDDYSHYIKANSDIVMEDISEFSGDYAGYDSVIIADKEQIYIKSPANQEIIARYDQMSEFSFSKEDILKYVPLMYVVYICVVLLTIFVDYGYYLLLALVNSWVAGVIASFMNVRLGGRKLFHMSVYAGTTAYLVGIVQILIGKTIPNFNFFSILLTLGYMFFAIKDYKESGFEELPSNDYTDREE